MPIDQVFAQFADSVARQRWGTPSDTAILIYDEANFQIGGRDVFRCGGKNDPRFHGETHYHVIDKGHRIVSSETIDTGGRRLSVSLTTVEFEADGNRTRLRSTVQVSSLDGQDMIEGTKFGTNAALDNLVRHLQASAP